MMKKLLTLILGLGLAFGAAAQIDQDDILMWVGPADGDGTAVVSITWSNPDTGFVWGVRYDTDEGLDPLTALQYIAAGDPRFSYTVDEAFYTVTGISALNFNNDTLDLSLALTEEPCVYVDDIIIADPDEWSVTWCDDEDGSIFIAADCYLTYTHVAPVQPLAEPEEESTITANEILYWVGNGNDTALFVLDWSTGARAWGYLFNDGDSIGKMISDIEAADPRFADSWGSIAYFEYPVRADLTIHRIKANGVFVGDTMLLTPGMIVKMGTPATNVWDTEITPASIATVPVDATIAAEDILYWVGEGSDSLVVAINWGNPDTALAWGLLFDGNLTVQNAIVALAAADPRLTLNSTLAISNIMYNDGVDSLGFQMVSGNYLQFNLDGNGYAGWTSTVNNGSFLKIAESAYGIGVDSTISSYGMYPAYVVWPTEIHPVSALDTNPEPVVPEDATIAASEIVYWVGEGSNEVVFAVNWVDTALAWGYRFSADSVTVETVMNDIQAADPRFSYSDNSGGLNDIFFVENSDTLKAMNAGWWMSTLNGSSAASMGMTTVMHNNDIFKWGDFVAGTTIDTVTYDMVFTTEIHPVSVPTQDTNSIANIQSIDVVAYPNPTASTLYVTFEALQSNTEAVLFDMSGRRVMVNAVEAGSSSLQISTDALANGIYMLRIGTSTTKVVVRH